MKIAWKTVMKWAAKKAFQWGLKKLVEEYGEKPKGLVTPTVRHRKPYTK